MPVCCFIKSEMYFWLLLISNVDCNHYCNATIIWSSFAVDINIFSINYNNPHWFSLCVCRGYTEIGANSYLLLLTWIWEVHCLVLFWLVFWNALLCITHRWEPNMSPSLLGTIKYNTYFDGPGLLWFFHCFDFKVKASGRC